MTPEQIVSCVPFSYITDVLTPAEALEILTRHSATRQSRELEMLECGYPAYTTSAGWLGYSDGKLRSLVREGLAQGWTHFKMKVGRDLAEDMRRDRKSTRLNSSHSQISYAVFCLKKKKN